MHLGLRQRRRPRSRGPSPCRRFARPAPPRRRLDLLGVVARATAGRRRIALADPAPSRHSSSAQCGCERRHAASPAPRPLRASSARRSSQAARVVGAERAQVLAGGVRQLHDGGDGGVEVVALDVSRHLAPPRDGARASASSPRPRPPRQPAAAANSVSSPALPHQVVHLRATARFRNLYMPGRPSSFHSSSFSGGPKNRM